VNRPVADLHGSIPPLVCPFRHGKVDTEAYAEHVRRQASSGSGGILVNGTTGEPSVLTIGERKELAEVAVEAAGGRIPIVVATGSQSYAETLELTTHAATLDVAAVLVVTPYYIRPSQPGLIEYYVDLAGRTDLPVLVYHIPGRAAVGVTVDTLAAIRDRAPNLVGIKHAVGDLAMVTDMVRTLGPEFRIFAGLEDLSFPMLALGAVGVMNAVGNLVPDRVAQLCHAVAAGDLAEARARHEALTELNRAVFFETNPVPMKYMMRRLGLLDVNEHRLPMIAASPELERRLDDVLIRAGLL